MAITHFFIVGLTERESGEMVQWLRVLVALPEVLSSIPSTHIAAHSLMPSTGLQTHMQTKRLYTKQTKTERR